MGPALLLAAVIGVARIPIPESAMRFPDASGFAGVGARPEVLMVEKVLRESGEAMRAVGPGPQQIVARWEAGTLNAAEKVAALLGGAAFHDAALLPIYRHAARDPDPRVLRAGVVGFFALIGDQPPVPSAVGGAASERDRFADLAGKLAWALRTGPLVRVWVDSYAAARGVSPGGRFALRRTRETCMAAIRSIARPEDLPELLALWPLLDNQNDRVSLMRTIEIVTLQKLVNAPVDPSKPRGEMFIRGGLAMIDAWVAGLCRPVNGLTQVRLAFERNRLVAPGEPLVPEAWFKLMRLGYAPFLPLAVEHLADLTGTWVSSDRHNLHGPQNNNARKALAEVLPVSSGQAPQQQRPGRVARKRRGEGAESP
jgi:hypothetical protein